MLDARQDAAQRGARRIIVTAEFDPEVAAAVFRVDRDEPPVILFNVAVVSPEVFGIYDRVLAWAEATAATCSAPVCRLMLADL
jgi:hypothetical protein